MKTVIHIILVMAAVLFALPLQAEPATTITALSSLSSHDWMAGLFLGGMVVNKDVLISVFTALKSTFNKAFEGTTGDWQKTAMLVTSSTSENRYNWFARFPRMRKWIGDKKAKALEAFGYTIVNDDYEATVEVRRNDIEDDQLGGYTLQAQDAGQSSAELPDIIVSALKNGAFTALCFDGQYFYDTDHEVKGASVSNKGTAALSVANLAGAQAGFGAARTAIMTFTDDEGEPLGLMPDILEVPPALEATARILLEKDKLTDNSPNPFQGTATLLVNPRLTSSTAWFLHCTTRPVKPFIYQERKKPIFVSQTDMSADDVFNRALYKFGAEARVAGGYGFWQLSYGSTGAG